MKYRATDKIEVEVVDAFDEETDAPETSTERFRKSEIVSFDIVSKQKDVMEIQFGNGSVAYGVPVHWFEPVLQRVAQV